MTASQNVPLSAVFSAGFRPFFLGAGIWATLAMCIWLGTIAGVVPMALPYDWHVHEFLFGYLGAAIAGFLLTAAPSWTKQNALSGPGLVILFSLWFAARLAMLGLGNLPALPLAVLDLSMPVALSVLTARQIWAAKNWRNLSVLAALVFYTAGNAVFHWEVAQGLPAAQGAGTRLGLGAALMLISVVGGRIAPNFTRNWLKRRGETRLPVGAGRLDLTCHGLLAAALVLWLFAPYSILTGVGFIAAGVAHFLRMRSWQCGRTLSDPLLWVLHAGYAFLPFGALTMGAALLWPSLLPAASALHLWSVGALGLTTMAVMTRATLAHTGAPLTALKGSALIYLLIIAAAVFRPLAGLIPELAIPLQTASALCWIAGFGAFVLIYGKRHLAPDT